MMRAKLTRTTIVLLALAWFLIHSSDVIHDLQNWHGATTPEIVAELMKNAGRAIWYALAGNIFGMPGPIARLLNGPADQQIDQSRFVKS